jgi:hypothetical protein
MRRRLTNSWVARLGMTRFHGERPQRSSPAKKPSAHRQMKRASKRKHWQQIGPSVAPFPHRDTGLLVGAFLTAALIASPAVAVSPAPPPPDLFSSLKIGDALRA